MDCGLSLPALRLTISACLEHSCHGRSLPVYRCEFLGGQRLIDGDQHRFDLDRALRTRTPPAAQTPARWRERTVE
jgi:hypothetical protein